MVTENLNKSKLKTNTSTRKSILNLVALLSFSISGKIWAEKIYVESCKNYRRLYDWGYNAYPHTNVCNFYNFQHTFSQLIFHMKYWNLAGLLKLRCSFQCWYWFLILAYSNVFEFSAAILEKGLLASLLANCFDELLGICRRVSLSIQLFLNTKILVYLEWLRRP